MERSSVIAGCMRWGSWGAQFTTEQYSNLIHQCIDNGITTFDHADIYGHYTTEEEFGRALSQSKINRNNIHLITKFGIQLVSDIRSNHTIKSYNTSAAHINQSVEQSLRNFRTDYIDTLLIHRPDPLMNIEEIVVSMELLLASGKVLQFGVSNFLPHQVELFRKYIQTKYNQIELSLTQTTPLYDGTLDYAFLNNIAIMAWSPMGQGLFSGENHLYKEAILKVINSLAIKYNCQPSQIPIAWLNMLPCKPTSIIGSTKIERIKEAKEAINIKLDREDWYLLLQAATGKEVA